MLNIFHATSVRTHAYAVATETQADWFFIPGKQIESDDLQITVPTVVLKDLI